MAIIGDVGSGFTPPIPVKALASLVITGVGGFAGVMGREGWNDLAVGLREGHSDFAAKVGVLSESLISPSSREVGSMADEGWGEGVDLVGCASGLGELVADSSLP